MFITNENKDIFNKNCSFFNIEEIQKIYKDIGWDQFNHILNKEYDKGQLAYYFSTLEDRICIRNKENTKLFYIEYISECYNFKCKNYLFEGFPCYKTPNVFYNKVKFEINIINIDLLKFKNLYENKKYKELQLFLNEYKHYDNNLKIFCSKKCYEKYTYTKFLEYINLINVDISKIDTKELVKI